MKTTPSAARKRFRLCMKHTLSETCSITSWTMTREKPSSGSSSARMSHARKVPDAPLSRKKVSACRIRSPDKSHPVTRQPVRANGEDSHLLRIPLPAPEGARHAPYSLYKVYNISRRFLPALQNTNVCPYDVPAYSFLLLYLMFLPQPEDCPYFVFLTGNCNRGNMHADIFLQKSIAGLRKSLYLCRKPIIIYGQSKLL